MIDRRKNTYGVPVDRRSINRRAFPRWPAQFEVCFGTGTEMITASAIEIGEGGLSFHSENAIALESEINVEYRLDAGDWVKVRAVVRHVDDGCPDRPGKLRGLRQQVVDRDVRLPRQRNSRLDHERPIGQGA